MLRVRYLLLAVLLLGTMVLTAQVSPWEHYSYGETVLAMAHNGNNVLIGTKTGVVRYDISTQQKLVLNKANSPLPDNWVAGVAISPTGLMALGTPEGICIVDDNSWQIFNTSNATIPSNRISKTMISPNGTVWALSKNNETYDYLYAYANGEWSVHYHGATNIPGQRIQDFTLDPSGNPALVYYHVANDVTGLAVWSGTTWVDHSGSSMGVTSNMLSRIVYAGSKYWMTDGNRIYSWDGSQSEVLDPNLPQIPEPYFISLGVDGQGDLLAGYLDPSATEDNAYLARYDGTNWTSLDPNVQVSGLNWPSAVMQTPDGCLWIGTQSGAAVFDGVNWNRFVCSNSGLPTNDVKYITVDSLDRLWMTVNDPVRYISALVKLEAGNWTVYGPDLIPDIYDPLSISPAPDGSVWFVNYGAFHNFSVMRFDGSSTISFDPTNTILPAGSVNVLEVDSSGNVWVTIRRSQAPHENELCKFDGSEWSLIATTSALVRDITTDSSGNLWLATNQGVMYLHENTLIEYNSANSGMTIDNTNCLQFDSSGNLWIGTALGLTKYSSDGSWQSWDPVNGDPFRVFLDLEIDSSGRVWGASSSHGLICFDGDTWTAYTTQNSPIPTSVIKGLALDSQHRMWIITQWQGITCFDISSTPIVDPTLIPSPGALRLANHPNPSNPTTTITLRMKESSLLSLEVFNVRGQRVRKLFSGTKSAGDHNVLFDGQDDAGRPLGSGIYILKAIAGKHTETRRMMLMK